MYENVSASDIGCMCQAGVTDERICDVSVPSDMIEIRDSPTTCNIYIF